MGVLLVALGLGASSAQAEEDGRLPAPRTIDRSTADPNAPPPFPAPPPPPPPPSLTVAAPWSESAVVMRPQLRRTQGPYAPPACAPCPPRACAPAGGPPAPYRYRQWCSSPWIISARLSAWGPKSSGTFQDLGDTIGTPSSDQPEEFKYRGIMGQLELRRGAWSARFEKTYVSMSGTLFTLNGTPVVDGGAEADMDQTMIGYRFAPISLGAKLCNHCVFLSAELNAGLRFYDVDIWAEAGGARVKLGTSEVDPVVGMRFEVPLTPRWMVYLSGDVGGFGVGLDLSYMVFAEVGYAFSRHWSMQLGWRYLRLEKSVGFDALRLRWHTTLSGPLLAVKYTF